MNYYYQIINRLCDGRQKRIIILSSDLADLLDSSKLSEKRKESIIQSCDFERPDERYTRPVPVVEDDDSNP